ncbi:toxin glutamine deamidase domain-containing protein [Kitasatospora sp. NPDC057512]|uniref:toxin glutamine deamidase domain-containing protein n=1 Tax=Kitasatospora sp. NPDC057512 TaxID=3346154 RepID=UPI0036883A5A
MSRNLPEELVPVLARTGRQWPQADEEGLRKAAGVWREFGKETDRLTRRCGESVRRVTADNSGHAVEAFDAYWQAFSGGGKGHLDDAHSAVGLVAGAFDTAARAVDSCKAEIIATLRQLAAELRQAEEQAARAKEAAGKVAAAAAGGDPAGSGVVGNGLVGDGAVGNGAVGGLRKAVGGLAATVENAATEQVAAGVAAVAVETAALKIGGLLAELGRAMKDALSGVLEEPAAVALLKLGSAPGTGVTAASYRNGAFDPLAAGLPAALAEPGVLGADGSGLALLAGRDGKPLVGVPGLTVKVDEQGRPVLGPDGRPVILRADGTPVADATGLLVVPGPDGKPVVGVADLAVRLDEHGQPVLTDEDGKALRGVPLAGLTPGADRPGADRPGADGPGGDKPLAGAAPDGPAVPKVPGAVTVASAAVADPGAVGGGPDVASASVGASAGGASAGGAAAAGGSPGQHRATGGGGGGGDWAPPAPAVAAPVRQSGGSAGWSDGDYPLQAPAAASHSGGGTGWSGGGGPVTVRTDSVSAPAAPASAPVTAPPAGGPAYGPAPETPSAVRPVGVPGQFGTPAYGGGYGGYQAAGPVATVGPGPLAGTGGGPANVAAPFGSGVGAGATGGPGGVVGGGPAVGGPTVGGPAAGGPQPGAPVARTPVGAVPPPAAPPVVGTTPVIGRPEAHPVEARRRESAAGPADPTLAWGAVPVATAHAMALQLALRARRGAQPEDPAVRPRSIADSRPYGLPGGLAPVDPEHQAELERRAPRDADGLPVRHPDPAAGGWAEAVNDGGHREPGRANNSLEIALSAVECYTGRPTCAAPRIPTEGDAGERGGRDRAERELGAPFRDLGDGAPAFDRLADGLRRAGHGSQAVLLTLDAYGRPHAWNAVNHQDAVTYLDHQLARQAPTPLHPATHGLWAIALTPEGRPLPLTPAA